MEQQSRWQSSEQRSERREQVTQQQVTQQRTEHHYTRQMMTQQRGQFPQPHITHIPLTQHTLTYFDYWITLYAKANLLCYENANPETHHVTWWGCRGRKEAAPAAARLRVSLVSSWCVTLFVHSAFPPSETVECGYSGARVGVPAAAPGRCVASHLHRYLHLHHSIFIPLRGMISLSLSKYDTP